MQPSRPGGISIARALRILPGIANDDLRDVVAAIDLVHGDGDLSEIPLSFATNLVNLAGRPVDGFFAATLVGQDNLLPRSIRVRVDAPHRRFVVLHEIGHFLDAAGLPGTGYSSERHQLLAAWRQSIRLSSAFRELLRLTRAGDFGIADRAFALLEPAELWARSYAQFVAHRSQSTILEMSLASLRRHLGGDVYFPRQWDDDDFVDTDAAIEKLFRHLGWIT